MRVALLGLVCGCTFHALELPDGGDNGPGPGDAPPASCTDPLEPNNSNTQPTIVSFDNGSTVSFAGLALCPAGDQDLFFLPIEVPSTGLHAVATRQVGFLELELRNMSGMTLMGGVDALDQTQLCVPSLPMGFYFLVVGAGSGAETRYNLKIELASTCN